MVGRSKISPVASSILASREKAQNAPAAGERSGLLESGLGLPVWASAQTTAADTQPKNSGLVVVENKGWAVSSMA